MKRIQILPEFVINQIAAGEVIERPASILKELLENSIDANSSMIRIYLENGGISSIKVVDDGDGIHSEDLPLVFVQHATSKITTTDDLSKIMSLGFRGEALASIASIARVNITSDQKLPSGTTIEVKDVFYNIPVRRKFLRSSTTEFNYLQEIFKRIALSNFTVGFMLYHNNKLIKNLPAIINETNHNITQKETRIIKLFGKKFIDNAIFFNSQLNGMELFGWVGTCYDVSGCNIQYFYINNRMVKDKLLNSAIKQATQKLSLPQVYCLYINLDPMFFDVNVHPTKQEVRFSDPKVIYSFVFESVLEAMGRPNISEVMPPIKLQSELHNEILDVTYQHEDCFDINNNIALPVNNKLNCNDIKFFPIFNNRYLIFEQKKIDDTKLMLLNVLVGLKWLTHRKMQQMLNVVSYQLIIPERIQTEYKNINDLEFYIQLLEKFKFEVDQINENVFLIRSIPDFLNLFNVNINYKSFVTDLFKFKLTDMDDLKFVDTVVANIQAQQLDLYTKNDLIKLVSELIKEKFCFTSFSEQEFSELL